MERWIRRKILAPTDPTLLMVALVVAILAFAAIRLLVPALAQLAASFHELNLAYQSANRGWLRPWTMAPVVPLLLYVAIWAALQTPARFRRLAAATLALVFTLWALLFIYRSSFIALDGQRYFSLFDDAMISMRYAWNFAHGQGLVFNPGERVEGYTNLLMTLIMALTIVLLGKHGSIVAIQLFGLLCLLAGGWLTWQIGRALHPYRPGRHGHLAAALSVGLLFTCYPLAYWALMGMETGLLTVLLLAATLAALRYEDTLAPPYLWGMAVALGLAYLTRPDSALVALWLFLYLLWRHFASPRPRKPGRRLLFAAALYGAFIAGMSLFRWLYYGQLLPNTYVLKMTGMPLDVRLANGWGFVQPYLQTHAPLYALAALSLLLPGRRRQKLLLFTIPLILLAYSIWVGGDPWPYWRFTAPGSPLLFVLVADLCVTLWAKLRAARPSPGSWPGRLLRRSLYVAWWTLVLLLPLTGNGAFLPEAFFQQAPYQVDGNRFNVNRSLAIRHLTRPDATVGVFGAGVIPYFSERPAIDFFGKADPRIAGLPPDLSGAVSWAGMFSVPGHNKVDLEYSIKTRQPTYIEAARSGSQDLTAWASDHYVEVTYQGVPLLLLRESRAVRWDRVALLP